MVVGLDAVNLDANFLEESQSLLNKSDRVAIRQAIIDAKEADFAGNIDSRELVPVSPAFVFTSGHGLGVDLQSITWIRRVERLGGFLPRLSLALRQESVSVASFDYRLWLEI